MSAHHNAPFGRMVRYVTFNGEVVTGIVTRSHAAIENRVNIQLFRDGVHQEHVPTHVYDIDYAPVSPTGDMQGDTWHWPPRG